MTILSKIGDIFSLFIYSLFPKYCAICGERGEANLCLSCKSEITFMNEIKSCERCSCPLEGFSVCPDCQNLSFEFSKLFCVFLYDGVGEDVIRKIKFQGYFTLVEEFSDEIKNIISRIEFDVIVPVPSYYITFIRRGYNPSFFIAKVISRVSGRDIKAVLEKKEKRESQLSLPYEKRLQNPKGAFSLSQKYRSFVEDKRVLLVDDVATTCATLSECTRVLKSGGAKDVIAFSLSRTPSYSR